MHTCRCFYKIRLIIAKMHCANALTTVVLLFEQKFLSLGQMKHRNETRQKGTRTYHYLWFDDARIPFRMPIRTNHLDKRHHDASVHGTRYSCCKNQYTQGAHVAGIWYRLSGTTYRQKESLGTTSHAKKPFCKKTQSHVSRDARPQNHRKRPCRH